MVCSCSVLTELSRRCSVVKQVAHRQAIVPLCRNVGILACRREGVFCQSGLVPDSVVY